ncbi:MAG: hypothetical protein PHX04_06850 [Bacilli bacterium]|nr:hypothetical protein [Bacilli bacterium]
MNRKQIRDLKKLTDDRNKGYVTYEMITICVTRLFSLLCGIKNKTEISTKLETVESIENISKIAGQKF